MSEPAGRSPRNDASAAIDRVGDAPAKPLISVCVPMYNNAATIERCLRSVLDQDGVEFEIVIVDDQSTDDGAAIATSLLRPGDRLIRNDSRLGLNGNHNRCLELARGDYIQFLHGDDWLLPGALKTLARCFDGPDVGLAFAPRHVQTDDLPWSERRRAPSKLHVYFVKLQRTQSRFVLGPADRGPVGRECQPDRRTELRDVPASCRKGRGRRTGRHLSDRRLGFLVTPHASGGRLLCARRTLGAPSHRQHRIGKHHQSPQTLAGPATHSDVDDRGSSVYNSCPRRRNALVATCMAGPALQSGVVWPSTILASKDVAGGAR